MKTTLILFITIAIMNAQFIKAPTQTLCDAAEYFRPDVFYVQGAASTHPEPTQATVVFGIEAKKSTAQEALAQASNTAEDVINAIKSNIKTELKIQTLDFTIQPYTDYDYTDSGHTKIKEKGFTVSNQISIETLNLNDVGNIIDLGVKKGVNSVQGVNFDISKTEKKRIKDVLIEQAIEDAKHKATIVLKELNMQIVSIKSVQITNDYYNDSNLSSSVSVGFIVSPIDS